jgi:predicted dehydrogenase
MIPNSEFPGQQRPFRVGLLGTGVIAAPHAQALRSLGSAVELVAVCDRDAAKAKAFQQAFSVPSVFEDLEAMIASSRLDVVHVLLPPTAHTSMAIACLERGCHVFVEKPFCLSAQECRSVMDAASANGRRVGVNHNLTFMPSFLRMVEEIQNWRLGAIQHVTVTYNLPMGLDRGRHQHWMFGSPERIMLELGPHPLSVVYRLLGPVVFAAALVSGQRILSNGQVFWDTWQASLACERGSAQVVLALGGEYLSTGIHAIGQDGEAFVDLLRNTIRVSGRTKYLRSDQLIDGWRNGAGLVRQSVRNHTARMRGMLGFGPAYEMQNFSMNSSVGAYYQALRTGSRLPVDGADGTAVVESLEAIIASALASQEVEHHAVR